MVRNIQATNKLAPIPITKKMRILLLLTFTVLTLNYSCKDNPKDNKNLKINQSDTTRNYIAFLNENKHYIGFIENFYYTKKNEVYIELYFIKDELDPKEYQNLERLADSLVYQDDENSRYKFPTNLSQKHFDLRGLSRITIYDENSEFICNADFVRVEYLNQNISSGFIAVFKPDKKISPKKNYYCISNYNNALETNSYTLSKDTVLTQNILAKLNAPIPYDGLENNGIHFKLKNTDSTVSIVNSDNYAYIVLVSGDQLKILYKSPEPENISDIKVIPIIKYRLPYLLTRNLKPESDVMWDKLLYFNGTEYINTNRQRID